MNKTKSICFSCVHEPFLRENIKRNGKLSRCSYCEKTEAALTIDLMADRIEFAFQQHFQRTPSEPESHELLAWAHRPDYAWSRRGLPVVHAIRDAVDIPRDAAFDIQQVLQERHYYKRACKSQDETAFCANAYYEELEPNGDQWRKQWIAFDHAIKTETRFFGHNANELLTTIFSTIEEIKAPGPQPLVIDIGPGHPVKELYRARLFQSNDDLERALCRPDLELGPPPFDIAPAGRMNARGISVFYGATHSDVALAEVRPPVGSHVAVARFEIVRPLKILSLGYLPFASANGSIFDDTYAELRQRIAFLQSLSDIMCEPVLPSYQEFEYVPTQAIADFLANERNPRLDGIAYPSNQIYGSGQNVVLFHKAARVERMDLPEGVRIVVRSAYLDDEGLDADYIVKEIPPPLDERAPQPSPPHHYESDNPECSNNADRREPSLSIDVQSLKIHEVDSVKVSSHEYSVKRIRETPSEDT